MRLIDANELKKAMWEAKGHYPAFSDVTLQSIYKVIDNAQTVEQNWRFYFDHGYKQAERDLKRPQGEWITYRVAFHLTCPFCGCNLRALKSEVFEGNFDYNFCPNCGADMRGGQGMLNDEGIGWKKIRRMRKSIFGGECPLAERPCEHFDCEHCENADTGGLKRTTTDFDM